MGGKAMLLVSDDETYGDLYNYDDILGKVEDIPTAIIRKSDGNIIKDFIKTKPEQYQSIHMVMKFASVIIINDYSLYSLMVKMLN
jgi:hypothetical protein